MRGDRRGEFDCRVGLGLRRLPAHVDHQLAQHRRQEVGHRGGRSLDTCVGDRGVGEPQRIGRVQAVPLQGQQVTPHQQTGRVTVDPDAVEWDDQRSARRGQVDLRQHPILLADRHRRAAHIHRKLHGDIEGLRRHARRNRHGQQHGSDLTVEQQVGIGAEVTETQCRRVRQQWRITRGGVCCGR